MASFLDLRQVGGAPVNGGRRVAALAGALAAASAAAAGLVLFGTASAPSPAREAQPVFLAHALGGRSADRPFERVLPGRVRIEAAGERFSVSALGQTVALASTSGKAGPWTSHDRGRTRTTPFGSETVVERQRGLEQYLTVDRHVGPHTWQWKLETGLTAQVVGDGIVRFVDPRTHRVSSLTIRPVQLLAADGSDVTPKSARWSVSGRRLELRLDDRSLPVPYVIDPAIVFAGSGTGSNGGATTFTIPIRPSR